MPHVNPQRAGVTATARRSAGGVGVPRRPARVALLRMRGVRRVGAAALRGGRAGILAAGAGHLALGVLLGLLVAHALLARVLAEVGLVALALVHRASRIRTGWSTTPPPSRRGRTGATG